MLFDSFSDDILKVIYEYIPRSVRCLVNRENHSLNYSMRYEEIMDRMKDSYLRYLIRNDLSFLFESVLNIEYYKWNKNTNIRINNATSKIIWNL